MQIAQHGTSPRNYDPHAGLVIVSDKGIIYYDNSSGNSNKGALKQTMDSTSTFQLGYGYQSFYYIKIE